MCCQGNCVTVERKEFESVCVVIGIDLGGNRKRRITVWEGADALDASRINLRRARIVIDQLARGLIKDADEAAADPDLIVVAADRGKIVAALHIVATVCRDLSHRGCGKIVADLVGDDLCGPHSPKDLARFVPKHCVRAFELFFGKFAVIFLFSGINADESLIRITSAR